MATPSTRQAVHVIALGRIEALCYRNTSDQHGEWYSVTVQRRFHDQKSGRSRTSSSFGRDDLLVVAEAMRQAYSWVVANSNFAGREQDPDPELHETA